MKVLYSYAKNADGKVLLGFDSKKIDEVTVVSPSIFQLVAKICLFQQDTILNFERLNACFQYIRKWIVT